MRYVKSVIFILLSALFMNCALLCYALPIHTALKVLMVIVLSAAFIYYNIRPAADKAAPRKQRTLLGGSELLSTYLLFFPLQVLFYVRLFAFGSAREAMTVVILNGVLSLVFSYALALNGMIRVFVSSKQLGTALRISLLVLWWIPLVNLVPLGMASAAAEREYQFLRKKRLLNESRKAQEVCKTQYPILMLHGIFFRDWKHFNYWGRIPGELTSNGARVFYGNHNSSLPVEQSGAEIKQRILDIMQETGCEKVNIIAHSKGGMDARYAISCLGMDAHVASLTTINTPHRGSALAGTLLHVSPESLVTSIGRKYKAIYTKLGDDECDFFGSVNELTAQRCAELNAAMPDREGVLYQSVGSAMNSAASTILPMTLGYTVIKAAEPDDDNDGLVTTRSMEWGNFLGVLRSSGKQGISHGDMIDLAKKNIRDFDVCEYYVGLVSGLKTSGL